MKKDEAREHYLKYKDKLKPPAKTPREHAYNTVEWALMVLAIEHGDLAKDARKALEVLK